MDTEPRYARSQQKCDIDRKPRVSCFSMDAILFLEIIVRFHDYQRDIRLQTE
jgi:hypothetical protein